MNSYLKQIIALAMLWIITIGITAQPRISIFFDHVTEIARQEKISVKEAAQRVRNLGVEGIDVRVSTSEAQLNMLDSNASLPIGTGIVPLKEVIRELLNSGYKGWFTVEHFGSPSMLEYTTQSVANIQAAWEGTQKIM